MRRALAAAAALLTLAGCSAGNITNDRPSMLPMPSTSYPSPTGPIAVQWPTPADRLTPGAVVACTLPRPRSERVVPASVKQQVELAYGYTGPTDIRHLEVDHRVPFALCGSNGPANLWPEVYDGAPQSTYVHNYKDQLEAVIIARVQHHRMSLHDGQQVFYGDWRLAWCQWVHKTGVIC